MVRYIQPNRLLFLSLCMIIAVWLTGISLDLQFYYWWFDILLHTAGGLWSALFLGSFFRAHHTQATGPWGGAMLLCAIVGGAMVIGVAWEFLEFILDRFIIGSGFSYFSGVIEDALSDLFFDLVGATIGYSLIYHKK